MDDTPTYSISLRLRRTTTEVAFVKVPVTGDLMQAGEDAEGHRHLDPEKVLDAAIRLGKDARTHWVAETEPAIEPHPIQTPPPDAAP